MEEGHKRVVKNTFYLYGRQIIILILGLLTTRIVLDKLGVSNYGIYTVVGSFVSMFTILNNVLQSATRRYLSLAIGKGDQDAIRTTFRTAVVVHVWISAIVVIALESIGLWFLNYKLNIAPERMFAANWVFQFSVIHVAMNVIITPYIATVTSHERFDVYSYISIFDVVGKILILFLLIVLPFDKLILYAFLLTFVSLISNGIYVWFCHSRFNETRHLALRADKPLLKEMLKFSGWDSGGNIMSVITVQGISILLNIFLGTVINAARGVANTVTVTVQQFVSGFIVAAEPQLVKAYARGEYDKMINLVFTISQMSLFLLAIFALPIWLEMEYVLKLWLGKEVPEYTSIFIKITILQCFTTYSNLMVVKAIVATGHVKELNMRLIPIELSILPIVYVILKLGYSPVMVYLFGLLPSIMKFMVNNRLLHRFIGFPSGKYILQVYVKNIFLVAVAIIPAFLLHNAMESGLLRFISVGAVSVISILVLMWIFALSKSNKEMLLKKLKIGVKQ